jgi:DNA-binding CsgD family transcriptional regulator
MSITMTTFQYPTPAQIRVVLRWNQRGVRSLAPGQPGTAHHTNARTKSLNHLHELMTRLQMHRDFFRMLDQVHRRDIGQLPEALLTEILLYLRIHGYVARSTPDQGLAPVPLTGRQLHVIRLLAVGNSLQEVAAELGTDGRSLQGVVARAREEHGCYTTAHLIACCYRNGWLPTHEELRRLFHRTSYLLGPGYIRKDDES